MSYAERHAVTITTNGTGDGTGYTPVVTGKVVQITYTKNDYAVGVDFDVTGDSSGVIIWAQDNVDATATVCPRQATHTTAGVAALYAAGGSAVLDGVYVANERVKIVVAAGGDTKVGTFHVVVV